MTTPYRPYGAARKPDTTLLVIAKQPRPGRVKTRLVPPCTPGQAADAWFGSAAAARQAGGAVREEA